MFHNLIPYIYSPFLDDIAIKEPNMIYEDKEVKGLLGICKYIIKYIRNTD